MPIKTVTAAAIAFMLSAAVAVQAAATLTVSLARPDAQQIFGHNR